MPDSLHPHGQGLVIGLTGGIGSGKSAAADLLAARGALVVDTDQIAHQLTAPGGAAMEVIREAFGNGVVAADGALNRPAMRTLAFEDPAARKRFTAKVFRNQLAAPDVSVLQLRLPAGQRARFQAGQYLQLALPDGSSLTVEPLVRTRGRLGLKDFDPCTILLNNDLSAGVPGILEDLHEQYLLPPLHAGWSTRRKSKHFQLYEEVSKRFGKLIGVSGASVYLWEEGKTRPRATHMPGIAAVRGMGKKEAAAKLAGD